jgi:hypothetical protein
MGRPRTQDLVGYTDYLSVRSVGLTTCRTYASLVRKTTQSVPLLTEANLTEYLYASVPNASRSTLRAAWRYFCAYAKEELGREVPDFGMLSKSAVRSVDAQFTPAPAVQIAVAHLINESKVTPTMLAKATWQSVKIVRSQGKLTAYINVREGRVTGALFPAHLLTPLLTWAAPSDGKPMKMQPLIPTMAGGTNPASALQLRKLANRALNTNKSLGAEEPEEEVNAVFDLENELNTCREQEQEEAPKVPAPLTVAPLSGPVSRFALSDQHDPNMSTSELMSLIESTAKTRLGD